MGVRRRGPRLIPSSTTTALLAALLLPACFGLSEKEQAMLSVHERNSQEFYSAGSYIQAQQQADMALVLNVSGVGMRMMRGFCLVKLGKALDDDVRLDESVATFENLIDTDGDENYRIWMGAGQAYLARALALDREAGKLERRLSSNFLSVESREVETQQLEDVREAWRSDLNDAESCLTRVFSFENQESNPYALIELVLVLNSLGDRGNDAVRLATKAVTILMEIIDVTNNTLQKRVDLSTSEKLALQTRIQESLDREALLRDMVAAIHFNLDQFEEAIVSLDNLEARQLITPAQIHSRATIHELLGNNAEAIRDLTAFLKLRALEHEYDDFASDLFERIERLESLLVKERDQLSSF
jgi:tetratricopeptide (TPR) repeat protein